MQFTFTTDSLEEARAVLELLEGGDWPSSETAGRPKRERSRPRRDRAEERPPWEGDDEGAESDSAADEDDPWASSSSGRSKPRQGRSGRSSGGSGRSSSRSGGKVVDKQSPNGFNRWELGLDDAPDCDCDEPAGKCSGWKGKDEPKGKPDWVAWRCAKAAGRNWKDKCDFFESAK